MRLLIPVTMAVTLAGLSHGAAQNPTTPAQTTVPQGAPVDGTPAQPVTPPPSNVPEVNLPPVRLVEPGQGPETTYLTGQIPRLPWLGDEALTFPEWAVDPAGQADSPFLRPGLGTSAIGGGSISSPRSLKNSQPLRAGPFDIFPRIGYTAAYGSGLVSGPGRESDTWRHSVRPGIDIGAGDHWRIGYTPTIQIYSSDDYDESVDHDVYLSGWAGYQNWRFRLNHGTGINSDPLVETASQTGQTTHSTSVGANVDLGSRGALDLSIAQNLRLTDDYNDVYSWNAQSWYDYAWRPTLTLGIGLSAGYDLVDPGTDMVNERLQVRVSGALGEKIQYTLSTGAEMRQFVDTDADTQLSPLVSFNLSYQVLQRTALSLGVSRDVGVSYYSDRFTENVSVQGGVHQTLTDRLSFAASGGVRFSSYENALTGSDSDREDDTIFAKAAFRTRIEKRTSASLSYDFRSNQSDSSDYSFDSHQVSLSLNWAL